MRPVATKEAVFEAAKALRDAGEDPSSRAVRDAVGGGSLATIQRHLRAWRAGEAMAAPADPPSGPYDALEDRLDTLTRALVGLRIDLAETHDHAVLAALNGLRADLADALAGGRDPAVAAELARLHQDLRALNAAIAPLMEEIRRLSADRDRLYLALTAAEKRAAEP